MFRYSLVLRGLHKNICIEYPLVRSPAISTMLICTRSRLSGSFLNEPYPEYSAAYPLFPAENDALPGDANTTPEDKYASITDRLRRQTKILGYGQKQSISAQTQSRTLDWDGYYAKWVNGEDIPGSVGAITLRIGRGRDGANPLKDSHIKRDIARCGVVGDEDPWELRRCKTDTVTRRLRLWVRWISLANRLRILNKYQEPKEVSSAPGTGPISNFEDRREDERKAFGEHDAGEQDEEAGKSVDETASSTADGSDVHSNPTVQSPTSSPTKLACKVTWLGKPVASFEICRCTGLPLTPGESLLVLPRGIPWSSCNLRLDLVATAHVEKPTSCISRKRSISEGGSSNCTRSSGDDGGSDDSSSQTNISSSDRSDTDDRSFDGTGDESNGSAGSSVRASAKDYEQQHGSETVLGSVMVDWKVSPT